MRGQNRGRTTTWGDERLEVYLRREKGLEIKN